MVDPTAPLVVGGAADPNLAALLAGFARAGEAVLPLLTGAATPSLAWAPGGPLVVDGAPREPRALFLRHDVFGTPGPVAHAWSAALGGWALAHPRVRMPNRGLAAAGNTKPAALVLAQQCGLRIPATLVTNDRDAAAAFLGARAKIAKPVAGGDLARSLDEAFARASTSEGPFAAPALVQERLSPPEVRVFLAGGALFAFDVASAHLDYRAANDARVTATEVPAAVAAPLRALAAAMGLDFCAADFKTAEDGALCFLEVNTGPMFARFDEASGGALCDQLVRWLVSAA